MPQHIVYESRSDYEKRRDRRDKVIFKKEALVVSVIVLVIGLIIFLGAVSGIILGHFK